MKYDLHRHCLQRNWCARCAQRSGGGRTCVAGLPHQHYVGETVSGGGSCTARPVLNAESETVLAPIGITNGLPW